MGDLMRRIVWVVSLALAVGSGPVLAQDDGDDSPQAAAMRRR